jgi:hypothetical protein
LNPGRSHSPHSDHSAVVPSSGDDDLEGGKIKREPSNLGRKSSIDDLIDEVEYGAGTCII